MAGAVALSDPLQERGCRCGDIARRRGGLRAGQDVYVAKGPDKLLVIPILGTATVLKHLKMPMYRPRY